MIGIGIVDDRVDQREEISEALQLALSRNPLQGSAQNKCELFPSVPLPNLRDYPYWITENRIAALIVDERLKEGSTSQYYIEYDGHDVVKYLRPRMRNLPIIVVTGYQDEILESIHDEVTLVVGKDELGRNSSNLTNEIVKKAQVYRKDYTLKLARVEELSRQVALGKATSEDVKELRGLQTELQLPFSDIKSENDQWLIGFEDALNKLEALERDTKSFLLKIEETGKETSRN